jgi:hypothetical protein
MFFERFQCERDGVDVARGKQLAEEVERESEKERKREGHSIGREARSSFCSNRSSSIVEQDLFLSPFFPRSLTDLVEPAVRGEYGDVAVIASTGAARHGVVGWSLKRGKREGEKRAKRGSKRRCLSLEEKKTQK